MTKPLAFFFPCTTFLTSHIWNMQKLALKLVKGIWHAPYEEAQRHRFSPTRRRIRGDLLTMFKVTHGLLEFPVQPVFNHPTRTWQHGHAFNFH